MKKVLNVLAALAVALPLMTLEASTLTNPSAAESIKPTQSICYIWIGGVPYPVPCG